MIELLRENLNMPESCVVNKRIHKKIFYDNYKFTPQDKKNFKNDINSIYWLYSVKPDNSNIAEFVDEIYEYKEIALISVNVLNCSSAKRMVRIEEIVHRSIPYGTVLFIYDNESLIVSCSEKRISSSTKEELVTDKIISTDIILRKNYLDYLNGFSYENFNLSNLKQFNSSLIEKLVGVISLQRLGYSPVSIDDPIERKRVLDKIVSYEEKIDTLRRELKSETQINKKIEINVKIKNIETQVIELKKQVS